MNKEKISDLKSECNLPKEKLMSIYDKLIEEGAIKKAEQLEKIIIKLEIWQNK